MIYLKDNGFLTFQLDPKSEQEAEDLWLHVFSHVRYVVSHVRADPALFLPPGPPLDLQRKTQSGFQSFIVETESKIWILLFFNRLRHKSQPIIRTNLWDSFCSS